MSAKDLNRFRFTRYIRFDSTFTGHWPSQAPPRWRRSQSKLCANLVKALREAPDWESRLPGGGIPSQGRAQSVSACGKKLDCAIGAGLLSDGQRIVNSRTKACQFTERECDNSPNENMTINRIALMLPTGCGKMYSGCLHETKRYDTIWHHEKEPSGHQPVQVRVRGRG